MFIDKNGKEHYKCKACGNNWAKNATRLQEHLDTCTLCKINESSNVNKKQKLTNLDNFTKQDQIELETLLAPCPFFNIPSHHVLSDLLLNKEYKNQQEVVQNILDETPYHCLVSDGRPISVKDLQETCLNNQEQSNILDNEEENQCIILDNREENNFLNFSNKILYMFDDNDTYDSDNYNEE
ncbi:6212_t:CDS:2 [Dentiscutata heterogama]|uniref:6212_t:CDS:1 n=1 Tax=Dentiscutata heterogama TaxID=1316150 RepID=A0ACA9LV18_9GLOM|nr:6212_t:CDS:2 [Dentiscutata heterogama]